MKLTISEIENKLYAHIVKNIMDWIRKKTRGSEERELTDIIKKLNDYSIVSRIVRLKKYYDLPPEVVKSNISPEFSGLGRRFIDSMCEAADSAEVFRLVRASRYGRLIENIDDDNITGIGPRVQYRISRKNIHFSTNPSVVMLSFMFLSETELMNVISLIEGIRYGLDPKVIQSLIIH